MKIINGDCLDLMHNMADKSIDLILTDPPYGIGEDSFRVANRGKLAKTRDYGKFVGIKSCRKSILMKCCE